MSEVIYRSYCTTRRFFERRWHLFTTRDARRALCGAWVNPITASALTADRVRRADECEACHRASKRPWPAQGDATP